MPVVWEYVFPRCWTPQAYPGKKNSRMTSTPCYTTPCGSVVSTNWEFRRKPVPIQNVPRKYAFLSIPPQSRKSSPLTRCFFPFTNATRNQRPSFPGTGIAKHVFRCSEEELHPGTKKQKIKTDIVLAERYIHVSSYFTKALTSVKRHKVNSKSIDPCSSEEGYSIYALGKLSVCRHI